MKRLPPLRILLALVLALTLTLTPLTPAMAFDASEYAENGLTMDFCKTPISGMIESGLDSPEQWFETPYNRALLLASALGDLQYMGVGDFHDDINWDHPVVIFKSLADSTHTLSLLFTYTTGEPCIYEMVHTFSDSNEDRSDGKVFIIKISPSYIEEKTGIDDFSNPTISQFLSFYKNSYSVPLDDDDYVYETISYVDYSRAAIAVAAAMKTINNSNHSSSGSGSGSSSSGDSDSGTNSVPNDGGYYLPSPDAWFGNRMARNEEDSDYVTFVLKLDDLPALKGYEELLEDERFGLKLSDTFKEEYLDISTPVRYTYYVFDRKDGALSPYKYDVGLIHTKGDVIVIIQEKFLEDYCALIMYFDRSFSFVDVGDVCPYADRLTDRSAHPFTSSGSSSGSSSASSGSSGRQCSSCGGRGKVDCRSCYGKGYVEEYTWGEGGCIVTKNCPNINCHGGKVDCNVCGGDGWID